MITIQLDAYGLICAEGAIEDSYKKHVAHYRETGWPGIMDQPTREHLNSMVETHAAIIAALREAGYVMRNGDLEVVDIEELAAIKWNPAVREVI